MEFPMDSFDFFLFFSVYITVQYDKVFSVDWQFTYETQCLFGSIVSTSKGRVQETKQSKLLTYLPSARRSPPVARL